MAPPRLKLFMKWIDETPPPGVESNNPGDWDFGPSSGPAHTGDSAAPPLDGDTGHTSQGTGSGPIPPDPPDDTREAEPPPEEVEPDVEDTRDADADARDAERAAYRARPNLPSHPRSDAQDMSAVAGIDVLTCLFADIRLVQSVPACYREAWARANHVVYSWVLNATPGSADLDTLSRGNFCYTGYYCARRRGAANRAGIP